jgi:Mn-containing catalase
MNKPRFMIGKIPPTPGLVDQFFNTSTGQGEDGELDARGPWNQGEDLQRVEAPAFQALAAQGSAGAEGGVDDRTTSSAGDPEMIEQLLVQQLRDLLNAEGQLVKALPKMVKAARAESLKFAFEHHLEETKDQVERLKEVFGLVGTPAKGKPCKGMEGLLEEGNEVIEEGKELEDPAADLALIAAAQKVEHYEISAYGTARTMAGQIGLPAVAELLNKSLAEEEIADNLMTQLARELMSESRTGLTKEPKRARVTAAMEDDE